MSLKKEIESLLPELSNKKVEMLLHGIEWFLPDHEVAVRQELILEGISFWIHTGIVKADYFEHPKIKPWLKVMPQLAPISIEMMNDFIEGIVLLPYSSKEKEIFPEVNKLLKPASDKICEYYFSNTTRNAMIDKSVSKKERISTEILPGSFEIESTRKVLKEYIKGKPVIPFNKTQVNRLKVEYSLHQKKKYLKIRQELQPLPAGFECELSKEMVIEIYLLMTKEYIEGGLNDFLAVFRKIADPVMNPLIWHINVERGPNRGLGNKAALRDFLTSMLGKVNSEIEKKIPYFFVDTKGNKMELSKPKASSNYNFDSIIGTARKNTGPK